MLLAAANNFGASWNIESAVKNIVSYYGHLFLRTIHPTMWADFVESSLEDDFIYLIMSSTFQPIDLLKLAGISVSDLQWGGYQDIFVEENGDVVAWYHGSATGFGSISHKRSSGLIGRIASYFPAGNPEAKSEHERYLRNLKQSKLKPNFRNVFTIKPEYTDLHKCWTMGLEAQVMCMTTLNVDLPVDGKSRTVTTREWVSESAMP